MASDRPVEPSPTRATKSETRAKVLTLHGQGLGRNEIARQVGCSGDTVTRIARAEGLDFDRSETARAVESRKIDLAARRAELQTALLGDAERLRRQLWAPCRVFNFGGKDNTYEERELDKPPFADQLKIVQAVGVAVDRSLRLADHDSGTQAQAVNLIIATAQQLGLADIDGE